MTTRIIRIGNSQGIRIPKQLLDLYGLRHDDPVELERRSDGILLKIVPEARTMLTPAESYAEMVVESAEAEEWDEWDAVAADGM